MLRRHWKHLTGYAKQYLQKESLFSNMKTVLRWRSPIPWSFWQSKTRMAASGWWLQISRMRRCHSSAPHIKPFQGWKYEEQPVCSFPHHSNFHASLGVIWHNQYDLSNSHLQPYHESGTILYGSRHPWVRLKTLCTRLAWATETASENYWHVLSQTWKMSSVDTNPSSSRAWLAMVQRSSRIYSNYEDHHWIFERQPMGCPHHCIGWLLHRLCDHQDQEWAWSQYVVDETSLQYQLGDQIRARRQTAWGEPIDGLEMVSSSCIMMLMGTLLTGTNKEAH